MEFLSGADLAARLEQFLARRSDLAPARVTNLTRLSGGAVHQTWAFDATFGEGENARTHTLVARIDAPGRADPEKLEMEYRLLELTHGRVPVPRPFALGDDSLGTPFFLMERVQGQTNPGRLVRNVALRSKVLRQLASVLAQIHGTKTDGVPTSVPRPQAGLSPAAHAVREAETRYRDVTLDPHPTVELAFRWLKDKLPAIEARARPLALVHGDFRVGNFVYNEDGVAAILDWEIAHLGDPMEDLGWLSMRFWRFGNDDLPVGGLGTREEFAKAYEAAGGTLDPDAWQFWEVLANVRWAAGTMQQARVHLDGEGKSQELAAIGRRTGETELALLELMS